MDYKFQRTRIDKIAREKIIGELEKVAEVFKYIEFGKRDFAKLGNISATTVENEFGTWRKGLEALREHLRKKDLDLSPRKVPYNQTYSDEEMFKEMDKVWTQLKHRPSRNEWELFSPQISYGTYTHRFKGWQNACLKFIEYKMGTNILVSNEPEINSKDSQRSKVKNSDKDITISTRTVPVNIRLKVLDRDAYRCTLCGRSPATDIGVRLHIDHKIPFSKGGGSTIDNLQTLCQDCNLGKSDEIY